MSPKKAKTEETPTTPAPYVPKYIRTRTIVVNERKLEACVRAVLNDFETDDLDPAYLHDLMNTAMKALLETRGR
jgi:hypothetical protein